MSILWIILIVTIVLALFLKEMGPAAPRRAKAPAIATP